MQTIQRSSSHPIFKSFKNIDQIVIVPPAKPLSFCVEKTMTWLTSLKKNNPDIVSWCDDNSNVLYFFYGTHRNHLRRADCYYFAASTVDLAEIQRMCNLINAIWLYGDGRYTLFVSVKAPFRDDKISWWLSHNSWTTIEAMLLAEPDKKIPKTLLASNRVAVKEIIHALLLSPIIVL